MKYTITLLWFFTCFHLLPAQNTYPPPLKNDLGLDLAHWLRADPGVVFVWKHAVGREQATSASARNALRLLGGFYRETLSPNDLPVTVGDIRTERTTTNPLKRNYFLYGGLERQIHHRRWRFYFGGDAGYRYSRYTDDVEERTKNILSGELLSTDQYQGKVNTHYIRLSALGGVQFMLARRWSIGLELSFDAGLEFSRGDIIRDGVVTFSDDSTSFASDAQLLRLLYMSYHFGTAAAQ